MSNSIISEIEQLRVVFNHTIGESLSAQHIDKFVKSQVVAKLRTQGDIIAEIEEFHLPCVTALICNSALSIIAEKGVLYKNIRPLYSQGNPEVIKEALLLDIEIFEREILPYIDNYRIREMLEYGKRLSDSADKNNEELTACMELIKTIDNRIQKNSKKLEKDKKALEESGFKESTENGKRVSETADEEIEKSPNDKDTSDEEETMAARDKTNDDDETAAKLTEKIRKLEESIEKDDAELAKSQKRQEKLQQLVDCEYTELDRLNPYMDFLAKLSEEYESSLNQRRSECYEKIRSGGLTTETELLDVLLQSSESTYGDSEQMVPIDNLFRALRKEKYQSQEIRAVVKLMQAGLLKQDDDRLIYFLGDYKSALRDFLVGGMKDDLEGIVKDPEYHLLFDIAITQEMAVEQMVHTTLWDGIEDPEIWKYIFEFVRNENLFAKFVSEIRGRVLRCFLEFLDKYEMNMPAFVQALSKQKEVNSDLIFRIVQNYDKKLSKANRDLRRANRRMDIQEGASASKIFSAMYEPMEKLEMLTYDIKVYEGQIKKRDIANQMVECVSKFRKGLEELEVFPAESIDNWKKRKEISYDRSKHRYEDGKDKESEQVIAKTLGFRYSAADMQGNEEPHEHVEYAKVIPVKG